MGANRALCAAIALISAFAAAPAFAQAPRQCASSAPANPSFDNSQHRLWYNRFWTGNCAPGLLFCSPGEPNWSSTAARLLTQTPAARRAELTRRMCVLGHTIGHEWARDNAIRRIDSTALTSFYYTLDSGAGDAFARLDTVERQARGMLRR